MSTELKEFKGRMEVVSKTTGDIQYAPSTLYLTRFSGGEKNGSMLQLTVQQRHGGTAYVQLTRDQVRDLVDELKEEFKL